MYDERYKPTTFPSVYWYEAIYAPGAKQMIHLKNTSSFLLLFH